MNEEIAQRQRRRFILISLAIPAALIAFFLLSTQRDCGSIIRSKEYREEIVRFTAADGVSIEATLSEPRDDPSAAILLVGDHALDRDWNSGAVGLDAAARIAAELALTHGSIVLRYDGRASRASEASLESRHDLDLITLDAINAWRLLLKHRRAKLSAGVQGGGILAHGEGCAIALAAVRQLRREDWPPRLALVSCWPVENYLQLWGERLLWNLERTAPPAASVEQARQEWQAFFQSGLAADPRAPDTSADLQVFRSALGEIKRRESSGFLKQARAMTMAADLAYFQRNGGKLRFFAPEYDEEAPPTRRRPENFAGHKFETIAGADHFLLQSDCRREGLALAWRRLRPNQALAAEAAAVFRWLSGQVRDQ